VSTTRTRPDKWVVRSAFRVTTRKEAGAVLQRDGTPSRRDARRRAPRRAGRQQPLRAVSRRLVTVASTRLAGDRETTTCSGSAIRGGSTCRTARATTVNTGSGGELFFGLFFYFMDGRRGDCWTDVPAATQRAEAGRSTVECGPFASETTTSRAGGRSTTTASQRRASGDRAGQPTASSVVG